MSVTFHSLKIRQIIDRTPDAYTLEFEAPQEGTFSYLPGQYLTLKVPYEGEQLRRSFSLSSSPVADPLLSVTIKRVEGGRVSNYLRDHYKAGDEIEVLPPMGNFVVKVDPAYPRHYVLIGAGSGITPLMSILKTVLQEEEESKVSLWYCNRDEDHVIFADQLEQLGGEYGDRLEVYHTLSRPSDAWNGPKGRLNKERIYELLSGLFMTSELPKVYYMCGPNGLMEASQAALTQHAVDPRHVHRELYTAPVPTEAQVAEAYADSENGASNDIAGYELVTQEVTISQNGTTLNLQVSPDQYILDAAIEAKMDPPYACQSGICTTCRAKLISGVVSMDEAEGLSEDELKEGFILTCQSHPLTKDVEVEFG
ncbi:MAG: ferredoxin--NADP reductase [Bacteroidota bacterium]